jgi:hypothetical protein
MVEDGESLFMRAKEKYGGVLSDYVSVKKRMK